ncbi:MAG: membrane protein insertase YidC [Deltaproteobacteria bacterium]|jgi:YidC/Oxa1 family membrane protein insertase|nr:membrane protein insertase YidC [Deltaproteobacteria bacterium]
MEKRVVVTMLVMMGFFMLVSYIYPLVFPPQPAQEAGTGASAADAGQGPGILGAPVAPGAGGTTAGGPAEGAGAPPSVAGDASGTAAPAGEAGVTASAEADVTVGPAVDAGQAGLPPAAQGPPRRVKVDTPEYMAVFTEEGGRLVSFRLKKYKSWDVAGEEAESFQELVNRPGQADPAPFPLNLVYVSPDGTAEDLGGVRFVADAAEVSVDEGGTATLVMTPRDKTSGLSLERVYTFTAGSYVIGQELRLANGGSSPISGRIGQSLSAWPFAARQNRYNVMTAFINRKLVAEPVDDAQEELADIRVVSSADFLGYMDQYFLTVMLLGDARGDQPQAGEASPWRFAARELPGQGVAATATRPLELAPGASVSHRLDFFYGPKETELLKSEGHSLSMSVDLGWFSFLAHPLGFLLRFFYGFVGNYGVAIIIVTVLIKIALWPLTAKSYKSMKKMQQVAEPVKKLRERYKNDPETMNREMMALYRAHGASPLGGCLPMLLQIPFFFAFYRVLDYALELRGAPFMLWIHDLSAPDRLFNFGMSIPFLAPPAGIPVLTLLMGGTMIWQQRMTPTMGDPMQAKVMMLLPLFFIVFLLNMPSGLVLYWLVNNILSIFQQKLINRDAGKAAPAPPAGKPEKPGRPPNSPKPRRHRGPRPASARK